MVAGGILPVCLRNNELYFLFGLENENEKDAPGWADFGGGCEKNETPYQTALREVYEESSGFLNPKELKRVYKLVHNDYNCFIVKMEYDENIIKYFNRSHAYIKEKKPELLKTVLFEKQKIEWFSVKDMIRRKKEFRKFYQEIVEKIVKEEKCIKSKVKNVSKTRKKVLLG